MKILPFNSKVKFTYHSNAIEGNSLSEHEVEQILRKGSVFTHASLFEHIDIINHQNAIDYMLDLIDSNVTLTIEIIKKLNEYILTNHPLYHEQRGCFRKYPAIIIGSDVELAHPDDIEIMLLKLIHDFNNKEKTVENMAYFHANFEKTHPFSDGNGRTGRLILNFQLLSSGYPITIFNHNDKNHYFEALEVANSKNNFTRMSKYILDNLIY